MEKAQEQTAALAAATAAASAPTGASGWGFNQGQVNESFATVQSIVESQLFATMCQSRHTGWEGSN